MSWDEFLAVLADGLSTLNMAQRAAILGRCQMLDEPSDVGWPRFGAAARISTKLESLPAIAYPCG
jgi:hypothetical protein